MVPSSSHWAGYALTVGRPPTRRAAAPALSAITQMAARVSSAVWALNTTCRPSDDQTGL